ncbi:MAG: glycosyltransferase [Candidatus Staskawiczbacteria bacterium]|nr:glycosyltransferase [Candidatus Staskawiczbacteria bacterium]
MKKKVVFFIPTLEAGGAERNAINLLSGISQEKYELILLVCQKRGQFLGSVPSAVPIFELGSLNSFTVFWRVAVFLRHQKPDLFISNLARFNVINLLAKTIFSSKLRMVVVEHTQVSLLPITAKSLSHRIFARFIFPVLASVLYRGASAVVAVSAGVAKDLTPVLKKQIDVRVIYNPVVSKDIFALSSEEVRYPWFADKKIPIILSVGRLVKAKNHGLLLKAVASVLKKKDVNLVILGEGNERKDLENLALALGIQNNVSLIGFKDNPFAYMAKADVFVNSSIREGFGNSIVEAMALGLPVISTDCSGPAEIIGDSGIIVPQENVSALADAIIKVLEDDISRKSILVKAKQRSNNFLIETSVKNYEKLFDQLLGE